MRISNKRINPIIEALYSLLIIGFIMSLILHIIPITRIVRTISPYSLNFIFLTLMIVLYKIGPHYFEYDSNGEALNIKTQDSFLGKHARKFIRNIDFPKKKITSFKINQFLFFKHLEIKVTSKRTSSGYTKLKFNITFLKRKEVNDLKISLNKIVKNNKNLTLEDHNE